MISQTSSKTSQNLELDRFMHIKAENVRTGQVRVFNGSDLILVPDSSHKKEGTMFLHGRKVENCLNLRKYSTFFVVADFVSKTGFPDKIKLQEIGPDGSVFEISESKIDCYRVMGIFLE
ncbi:hypothetical protein [Leptospira noguchii]|uniref:Uncharacterized protein n=2 Tax=Leptospira noguchii TaxID=28182 RepID=M6UBI3_9LEPT|nr:hypothetical protein [Leptospira noguchii]EMO25691.1 hypothetical protein LEP1GSC170_4144 [Leptospira interrogans serovar Bataviae str. HAI135]EMO42387.1 hypothetical protein LEP1GSC186_4567 [Leptospira noguchii serovar Autumnalis str. ZUN142]EMS84874.1 hypothetical protein LEP1GSC074_1177 [Leptospira noguchii str. Hook]UOG30347.1 hypothetical protein MAL06_17505 [Leptospira noguchii]UOG34053.1 hypothetical protein MAL02_16225 [Leptospira noguchii]